MPADEPVHVSPFNALLCLIILGVNAATQRSGADHFANVHLSPARTSPFICLADILTTVLWLGYGVLFKRIGFKVSAKMLFKDFGFSEEEDTLVKGKGWPWNIVLMIVFLAGPMLEAIKLFAFGATGTAPWLQTFAAAMFVTAYIVRVSVNTLSRRCEDENAIQELANSRPERLFKTADFLYDLAYSAQFHFWIEIFGKLEFFAEPNAAVVITVLVMVIFPALTSYFSPKEDVQGNQPDEQEAQQAAPHAHWRPRILMGRWALANWAEDDRHRAFIVAFVIAISTPSDTAWRTIFIPLAAFAVVVLHLALVSVVTRILRKADRRRSSAQESLQGDREDPGLPQDQLRERWNPLLRAESPEWRNTVSMAFGLSNLTFVCMYYFGVYDASKTVKPGWLEAI
ncbi:unnamed protein product [Aureobasidium mustum]|uniref:Uncharacterized protein n=1 Tax=Aureobasidium mustum TaxID=2773714 RepID=A0A9N8JHY8_9PEZI|nr:unnamed protein product [Aureobasidium mustum]